MTKKYDVEFKKQLVYAYMQGTSYRKQKQNICEEIKSIYYNNNGSLATVE